MYKNAIGDKNTISLDGVCYLIQEIFMQDDIGQDIAHKKEKQVFCMELPVYSQEFYNAGLKGIKAALVLVADREEYGGESKLKYNDEDYIVYKVYSRTDGYIELYCEVRAGV